MSHCHCLAVLFSSPLPSLLVRQFGRELASYSFAQQTSGHTLTTQVSLLPPPHHWPADHYCTSVRPTSGLLFTTTLSPALAPPHHTIRPALCTMLQHTSKLCSPPRSFSLHHCYEATHVHRRMLRPALCIAILFIPLPALPFEAGGGEGMMWGGIASPRPPGKGERTGRGC